MLQRLTLHDSVGPLRPPSLPAGVPFGQHTVIYGHNGSGKSSLADLLGAIGSGDHGETVTWHAPDRSSHQLSPGQRPPDIHVSAFTASWVRDNLTSFLSGEGEGAQAIITLGSTAVDTASQIDEAERRAAELVEERRVLAAAMATRDTEMKAECRHVQDEIVSALQSVDRYFSRNRFDIPSIGQRLRAHADSPISNDEHDRLVAQTKQDRLPQVEARPRPPVVWADLDARLRALVSTTPTSRLLDDIAGHAQIQGWVATGMGLHEEREQCYFCDGAISAARRAALDQHFDQSRADVVEQIKKTQSEVSRLRSQQREWLAALPSSGSLHPDAQVGRDHALQQSAARHDRAHEYLDAVDGMLSVKESAPDMTPTDGWPAPPEEEESDDALAALVAHHNSIAAAHDERRRTHCEAALGSMVGRRAGAYQALDQKREACKTRSAAVRDDLQAIESDLAHLRSLRFTQRATAELLTADLDRVYGKRHLTIDVTSDGSRYVCLRDGTPALRLSQGEQHTLALLYFLRTLDDASNGVDDAHRLVVVDDPSSSFDRECIFGTHARLSGCLERYGQSIVLTHDFELLRMFLTSRSSKLTKSQKRIKDGISTEILYPAVTFLEMTARASSNGRTSHLSRLSRVVQDHPSEYHFLFDRVVSGLEAPEDHDVLFLLPNAARRLLENFVSFRVPDRPNHRQRLEKLCAERKDAVFREVYDFCNRFSHGEDRHVAEPLDAPVALREIRRCLDFIRAVDPEHFDAMMRSAGRDPGPLIALPEDAERELSVGTAAAWPSGTAIP